MSAGTKARWPVDVSAVAADLACGAVAFRFRSALHVSIVAKASLSLVPGGDAKILAPDDLVTLEIHRDRSPERSVERTADLAPNRPRADVTLVGHAYAPPGAQVVSASARLAVVRERAIVDRTIFVYGDRDEAGAVRPFARVPLVYERAIASPDNPCGSTRPSLVDPADPARPACFGPVSRLWPSQRRLIAGADPRRVEAAIPELPDDLDWAYFQAAPVDQRADAIHGDEWIVLDGMHPALPRVQTRLPSLRAAARITRAAADAGTVMPLRVDLLAIDADRLTADLVWRVTIPVPDGDAGLARIRALVALELPGRPIAWPDLAAAVAPEAPAAPRRARPRTLMMSPADHAAEAREPVAPFAIAEPTGEPERADIPGAPWASAAPASEPAEPAGAARFFHRIAPVSEALPAPSPVAVRRGTALPIVNATTLSVATLAWQIRPPRDAIVVVVKGTFDLRDGGAPALRAVSDQPTADVHRDGDREKSLVYPSDFAIVKAKADVTLTGSAVSPDGPRARVRVGFRFGTAPDGFARAIDVTGDRRWIRGAPGEPAPFESLPVVWERAYGGPGFEWNPAGVGHGEDAAKGPLPNLEAPDKAIKDPGDVPAPTCFAPIPPAWKARWSKLGTFDARWQALRWPYFPEDFDPAYFQHAPPAQQLARVAGDEPFEITGMSAAPIRGALPGIRVRCFAEHAGVAADLDEIPLAIDAAHFDADLRTLSLVWRGSIEVADDAATDLATLFVMREKLAARPATLAEARAALEAARAPREPIAIDPPAAPANDPSPELDAERARIDADVAARKAKVDDVLRAAGISPDAPIAPPAAPPRMSAAKMVEVMRSAGIDDDQIASTLVAMKGPTAEQPIPDARTRARARLDEGEPLDGMDLSGGDLSGLDFSGRSLVRADLSGASLAGARFDDANLTGAGLAGCDASRASFTGADLGRADLYGARVEEAVFDRAKLVETTFTRASAARASFRGATGARATFDGADLTGARFDGARIDAADLTAATIDGASFADAELPAIRLYDVKGRGARFDRAGIEGARCDGASLPEGAFDRARAAGSVWEGATLDGAGFFGAKLAGAGFVRASCKGANFTRADAREGRFTRAILADARMLKANLMKASFERADLSRADLRGANLYAAETWKAKLDGTRLDLAKLGKTKLEGRA